MEIVGVKTRSHTGSCFSSDFEKDSTSTKEKLLEVHPARLVGRKTGRFFGYCEYHPKHQCLSMYTFITKKQPIVGKCTRCTSPMDPMAHPTFDFV